MKLQKYNEKRNFNNTSEPFGKIDNEQANRFVIQYHKSRAIHYDFRLEYNGVLLSWAVPKGLSTNPKDKRLAVHVEDHPVSYINFEGIIPKGNYGAGSVEIFDNGNYLPITDFKDGLKKGHLKFCLNGGKFKGAWSLIKLDDKNWIIVKIDDEYSEVKNSKKKKLPFSNCSVQLATLVSNIPIGSEWLFEIKYDGYRIVSYYEDNKVKMLSRNGTDYTKKFNNIAESLTQFKENNFVVDGEVVSFDENGRSDFGLLQNNIKKKNNNFFYVIFDLLALNGEDLRDLCLEKRKEKLSFLLNNVNENILFSKHIVNEGEKCFEFAKKNNLEGIMAKKSSSKYLGKRTEDWLKIKCYMRQEFIIIGFTKSEKNEIFSSLLLGVYDNRNLTYVGKVGTGFSESLKKELKTKFKPLIITVPHFNLKEDVTWLKPSLVAEIQFSEFTKDNLLRQASYIALREDKKAEEVIMEFKKSGKK